MWSALDDEPSYRTISVLALVSLMFGLAAPLCLMAPLLFVIPIAGVALALVGDCAGSRRATER